MRTIRWPCSGGWIAGFAGGRGAVAAVARMSPDEFTFSGIGNIGARLGSNGASAARPA